MAKDNWYAKDGVDLQGRRWAIITPDDANDLTEIPKALYVGGTAGNITMIGVDASVAATGVAWPVAAYALLPVRPRRILATGTTATPIIAIY